MRATLNPHRTETEKWMMAAIEGRSFLTEMDKAEKINPTIGEFWPFLLPYYSSLNSCFSPFYSSFFEKSAATAPVLLRDGVIPLAWFFSQKSPETVAAPLLVHESLAFLVPEHWRKQVRYYRHRTLSTAVPETLILVCPLNERFVSSAQVEESLDGIEQALGKKKMSTIKTKLFCRFPGKDHEVKIEWLRSIFERFENVSTLEWDSVEGSNSLKGTAYVEFNGGWFYHDSYVQQRILSRGASALLEPKRNPKAEFVPLSPYHGVEIVDVKAKSSEDTQVSRKLEDFFIEQSENYDTGLWPKWFERACRAQWQETTKRK